jgi:hypothetical protein
LFLSRASDERQALTPRDAFGGFALSTYKNVARPELADIFE